MSPSSDIETLFGHFGGNAGDYQEIGRENEASSARTRWPLLVTLDLTQPAIPAIPKRSASLAQPADEAAQALTPEGDPQVASGSAEAGRAATPQVRSKTPLFTRPHRRTIPPVGKAVKSEAPRGAERFSAEPQAGHAEVASSEAEPVATPPGMTPPALAPHTAAAPAAATVAATAVPPGGNMPPVWARATTPVAAPPVVASATYTAPSSRTPAAPAAPTVQPPSILGQLFKPAAPSTAPAARTSEAEATPASLGSLFKRLRGDAPTPATPAPQSWLTNGPRRS